MFWLLSNYKTLTLSYASYSSKYLECLDFPLKLFENVAGDNICLGKGPVLFIADFNFEGF